MKRTMSALIGGAAIYAVAIGTGSAAVIESGAGNTNCEIWTGAGCTTEAISVHPLWQPNNPNGSGAVWVSYADTGVSGSTLAPPSGSIDNPDGTTVIMTVEETFDAGAKTVKVWMNTWADDTAGFFVNGVEIKAPNFTQNICADGPIGCEPNEFFAYHATLGPGIHTLSWETYQVGDGTTNSSNPFGLLYQGSYEQVPEPATAALIGAGLLGLGFAVRRRRRQAE